MVETGSLHDAFVDQLRDSCDAKRQLLKALPKLARAQRGGTEGGVRRTARTDTHPHRAPRPGVRRAPRARERTPLRRHGGILEEALNVLPDPLDDATRDACLIAGAQRAMHYAIASDGVLTAWALMLQQIEAAELLQETLSEQKATDALLGTLAECGINAMAAGATRRPVVLGVYPCPCRSTPCCTADPRAARATRLLA